MISFGDVIPERTLGELASVGFHRIAIQLLELAPADRASAARIGWMTMAEWEPSSIADGIRKHFALRALARLLRPDERQRPA